jgi:hypothetical protein
MTLISLENIFSGDEMLGEDISSYLYRGQFLRIFKKKFFFFGENFNVFCSIYLFGEYFCGDEMLGEDRMKIQQLLLWGGRESNNDLVPFIIGDKFSLFDILLSVSFLFGKICWWLS